MEEKNLALKAIQKKLVGKKLSYREIYAVMDEIAENRLGDILTTYFVASGYSKGFTNDEIYYLTKAMVDTGEHLDFKGIVADKHSIGGVPGTRATLIVVPIIAAAGYTIPKSSSRAITTPAGTADSMEVVAKVTFTKEEIYKIVEKTNGCIVWGGSFKIAPADDEIIKIEKPLMFESYDKVLVSVMAKKIAFGSNHVVIDLPYGPSVKIHHREEAELLDHKFKFLAKKFDIHLETVISKVYEPAGQGVGPLLEARDALKVLEQVEDRPVPLEEKSLELASTLLKLCLEDSSKEKKEEIKTKHENVHNWVKDILKSGAALKKFREIIEAQKGDPNIMSKDLKPAGYKKRMVSDIRGEITGVNNINISTIAKILGAPHDKDCGMFLQKRIGDKVQAGEELMIFYSNTEYRLNEAVDSLELFPIYDIER